MMNYNFAADTEKLQTIESDLTTEINNMSNAISNIYKVFDSFPTEKIWSGEAYDSFKVKADSYKENLEETINILNSYVSVINEMSTQFEILHEDVSGICVIDKE